MEGEMYYRYLDSKYGPRWVNDNYIGISTTISVAKIEGQQRDESDSACSVHLKETFIDWSEGQPELKKAASRIGVEIHNSIGCIVGGTSIQRISGHILCLSTNGHSDAFPGKDWVIEILDLEKFICALGKSASGILAKKAYTGLIRYEKKKYSAFEDVQPFADPFIKEAGKGYEGESEYRIFWPAMEKSIQRIEIYSPEACAFTRLERCP